MENLLTFGETIRVPDIRMLYDIKAVLAEEEWLSGKENSELYYMYRELAKTGTERESMQEYGLRYDITVIPPGLLGKEYIKTAGHYHPKAPGAKVSYPEIYQVLEGKATYLLQKANGDSVEDVIVLEAKKGDVAVIPPDYGHLTINSSDRTLKMANWVCSHFSSLYEPMRAFKGGAYYLLRDGFVKNPNYAHVPEIRYLKPLSLPKTGLFDGDDMYGLVDDLEKLRFLKEPQAFAGFFNKIYGD